MAAVRCSPWDKTPPHSEPAAVASEPASVYQANTVVLESRGTTWASAACSIGKNGPTSLPLGLITPIVPATTRSRKSRVQANVTPAATMRIAPTINMRRRPSRSARVVKYSDTAVSPTSVSVRSMPLCDGVRPELVR